MAEPTDVAAETVPGAVPEAAPGPIPDVTAGAPRLSLVLVCMHGWEDLVLPLPGLRAQTIARDIELLVVAPPGLFEREAIESISGLFAVRLLETEDAFPRGRAAAVATAVARAPFIGLQETHSRADPEAFELILAAMEGGRRIVAPTFHCANAEQPWGAATYTLTHAHAAPPVDPAPRRHLVTHHAVYPAAFLRAHAAELDREHLLQERFADEGGTLLFHPGAVLWHIEAARPGLTIWIAYVLGRQFGWSRSRGWGRPERLARALLLPAIQGLMALRLLGRLRRLQETRPTFWAAAPHTAVLGLAFGWGEVAGTFRRGDPWPMEIERHEYDSFARLSGSPPALRLLAEALEANRTAGSRAAAGAG